MTTHHCTLSWGVMCDAPHTSAITANHCKFLKESHRESVPSCWDLVAVTLSSITLPPSSLACQLTSCVAMCCDVLRCVVALSLPARTHYASALVHTRCTTPSRCHGQRAPTHRHTSRAHPLHRHIRAVTANAHLLDQHTATPPVRTR